MAIASQVEVIKKGKRPPEEFSPDKLHRSIVATCLSIHTPEGQAKEIAQTVTLGVMNWCETKQEITSADIRRRASKILQQFHPDAAYLYEQHKNVL